MELHRLLCRRAEPSLIRLATRVRRALCAAVLLASLVSTHLAGAYVLARDGSGRPLTWQAPSVRLVVVLAGDPLDPDLLRATQQSAQRWAEATGLDIGVRAERRAASHVSEDGSSSVVLRTRRWCPDDPALPCHDPSRHALTQLYTRPAAGDPSAAEILEADIEINAVHFDWRALPPGSLDAVLLHELGHVLGLEHTCNASSLLERVDHQGAPVPLCRSAPPAARAAVMYPDPLGPLASGRLQLSDDERRAGAELYGAVSNPARSADVPSWLGLPAGLGFLGLGSISALWLARNHRRSRTPHGA